jgi:hypothetical protein
MNPALRTSLSFNFNKALVGFHTLFNCPCKESIWEDINESILTASGCVVTEMAAGGHASGRDMVCQPFGGLSNKSGSYATAARTHVDISSYRLTTACSAANHGSPDTICDEINRRKNFEYYSVVIREESDTEFRYDWFLLPSDLPVLNPRTYEWVPTIGQRGVNAGNVVGWHTNEINGSSMSVTFSMSSQLWMRIHITEEIRGLYLVGSAVAHRGRTRTLMDI